MKVPSHFELRPGGASDYRTMFAFFALGVLSGFAGTSFKVTMWCCYLAPSGS